MLVHELVYTEVQLTPEQVAYFTHHLSPAYIYGLNNLTAEVHSAIKALEAATQAYFKFDPFSWMGWLIQPDYSELRADTPERIKEAIEKLGSVTLYWQRYADELMSNRLGKAPDTLRQVIVISPELKVKRGHQPHVLKRLSQQYPEKLMYNAYLFETNWIGDGDFWGTFSPSIFPMNVVLRNEDPSTTQEVSRDELGISIEQEVATWKSRERLFKHLYKLYSQAVKQLLEQGVFHPIIQDEIDRELSHQLQSLQETNSSAQMLDVWNQVPFSRPITIARLLFKFDIHDHSEDDLSGILEDTVSMVSATVSDNVQKENPDSGLRAAADNLANNLQQLWQAARSFNSSS